LCTTGLTGSPISARAGRRQAGDGDLGWLQRGRSDGDDARYRECHDRRGTRTYSSTDGAAPPSRLRFNDILEVTEEYAATGEIQMRITWSGQVHTRDMLRLLQGRTFT
jgi:hypothetical protein